MIYQTLAPFYDLLVKHLKIGGLINSVFKLSNEKNKAGIEFEIDNPSRPFIGYDKTNKELVGSNDGINYFRSKVEVVINNHSAARNHQRIRYYIFHLGNAGLLEHNLFSENVGCKRKYFVKA